jgi:predicted transposase/invertase (TIGR01784 family)
LVDLPAKWANRYRFDSVEVKKSLRIDGLFLPKNPSWPLYFVEVQFQRVERFYANLFAKVFCYLEENDPAQDWVAVAIFASRNEEPKSIAAYEDFLGNKRVQRVYLDELCLPADPAPGLGLLQLATAPKEQTRRLVDRLVANARAAHGDGETTRLVIELTEELLIRKFSEMDREEVRKIFYLADLRNTRVWQEAKAEGKEEGKEEGKADTQRELVGKWLAKGMSHKQIADLLDRPIREIRRLAKTLAANGATAEAPE